jgi:hypothetical protein
MEIMAKNAVQRIHDVTSSMDGIEKLIDEVSRLSVNDDPLVVHDRAKLNNFNPKGTCSRRISRAWSKKRAEPVSGAAEDARIRKRVPSNSPASEASTPACNKILLAIAKTMAPKKATLLRRLSQA